MIRATTGGVLKSYRANLMNSFINQNKARDTVLSERVFNSYAEDPAAAAKAFRLRKARMTTESQYTICSGVLSKYQSAYSCLDTIEKLIDTKTSEPMNTMKGTTQEMLNDPSGDARTQLSKVLDQLSQSVVQTMNQTYAGNFIFAGADGHNVPFTIEDNKLYYRGVPVDAAKPELMMDGKKDPVKLNGDYVLASTKLVKADKLPEREMHADNDPVVVLAADGKSYYVQDEASADPQFKLDQDQFDALPDEDKALYTASDVFTPTFEENTKVYYKTEQLISKDSYDTSVAELMRDKNGDLSIVEVDGVNYHIVDEGKNVTISDADYKQAIKDAEKLKYLMMDETQYVDIGLGFQEDKNGNLIPSSGFDAALNGLTFLGCGLDEDGDPKNIYSLVQKMREIADSVPEEGQWDDPTYEKFRGLVLKLEQASSNFKTEFTNLTASTTKLENNSKLLYDNFYTLQEQYSDLEDVDMVEAIESFLYAEYAYNAALKVGNSILSQSLMDYLS